MARPSKYREEFAGQAGRMRRIGFTDEQMAAFFGVPLQELASWAWDHREFFDAITPSDDVRATWSEEDRRRTEARSAGQRRRKASNPSVRIAENMRARMWSSLRGKTSGACLSRLGYTIDTLRKHLEAQFKPGMTWSNYGRWHIDHVRPCASFNMADAEQFGQCWALTNLQPLWAAENCRKGARYVGS